MIKQNLDLLLKEIESYPCKLIAVTKTHPNSVLQETYDLGFKTFGENKVQEMTNKYEALPKDIEWHLIGHLQSNKVKYIIPYVHLIHGMDSFSLLKEINKQAQKHNKILSCLLQIYIAKEETKFGFEKEEIYSLLQNKEFYEMKNIQIQGFMGMASNTDNVNVINQEFYQLNQFHQEIKSSYKNELPFFNELSMGMSGDYKIALENGSTMIRVGSKIFGNRG